MPKQCPTSGGWRFDPDVQPPAYRLGQDLSRHSSGYGHGKKLLIHPLQRHQGTDVHSLLMGTL